MLICINWLVISTFLHFVTKKIIIALLLCLLLKKRIYIYIHIYNSINCKHNTKRTNNKTHWPFLSHGFLHGPFFLLGLQMWTSGSSLLSRLVVGVGIKQNAKCEMLLRKIDGQMNVQNYGFSAKLHHGNGGDMLHDWRQLSRTRAIVFQRDDMLPTSEHCQWWPGNPNDPSKFRKYRMYLPLLRLFTSMRSPLLFRGWRQQQLPLTRTVIFRRDDTLPTSKSSLEMTRQP